MREKPAKISRAAAGRKTMPVFPGLGPKTGRGVDALVCRDRRPAGGKEDGDADLSIDAADGAGIRAGAPQFGSLNKELHDGRFDMTVRVDGRPSAM